MRSPHEDQYPPRSRSGTHPTPNLGKSQFFVHSRGSFIDIVASFLTRKDNCTPILNEVDTKPISYACYNSCVVPSYLVNIVCIAQFLNAQGKNYPKDMSCLSKFPKKQLPKGNVRPKLGCELKG